MFEWYDHSRRCRCSFGEDRDKNVLYVVTNGAIAAPVNGTYTEGGKIASVSV